jgi:hypothetical protein
MNSRRRKLGQSLVEYSILVAVAVTAIMAITSYARMAFMAHTTDIEEELNGRPTPP